MRRLTLNSLCLREGAWLETNQHARTYNRCFMLLRLIICLAYGFPVSNSTQRHEEWNMLFSKHGILSLFICSSTACMMMPQKGKHVSYALPAFNISFPAEIQLTEKENHLSNPVKAGALDLIQLTTESQVRHLYISLVLRKQVAIRLYANVCHFCHSAHARALAPQRGIFFITSTCACAWSIIRDALLWFHCICRFYVSSSAIACPKCVWFLEASMFWMMSLLSHTLLQCRQPDHH